METKLFLLLKYNVVLTDFNYKNLSVYYLTGYTPVWKTGRIMLRGMASIRPSVNIFVSG